MTSAPRLLLFHSPSSEREALSRLLGDCGHEVVCATGEQVPQEPGAWHAAVLWQKDGDQRTLELLERLQSSAPELPVVVVASPGTVHGAVAAMKAGAVDYVPAQDLARLPQVLDETRTREARQPSASWLTRMMQTSPDAVVVVGRDGRVLFANELQARRLGFRTPADVVGVHICDLVPPEQVERVQRRFESIMAGNEPHLLPTRWTTKGMNGSPLVVEAHSVPIVDSTGLPTAVLTINRDVTEQVRADEEIRRQAQRLAAIVSTQNEIEGMGLGQDLHAVLPAVVSRLQRLLEADGAGIAWLENDSVVFETTSGILPSGCRMPADCSATGRAALTGEIQLVDDVRTSTIANRKLGKLYGIRSVVAAPLMQDGEVVGALAVLGGAPHRFSPLDVQTIDVMARFIGAALKNARVLRSRQTLLEQLEQRSELLNALLNGASDGVFMKDAAGRYLLINPPAARALGRQPEELVGKTDADVLPPELAASVLRQDACVRSARGEIVDEMRLTIDGVPRILLLTKTPFLDQYGEFAGIIGIVHDITELRRVEEERMRLLAREADVAEELRRLERWRSAFLQVMAHELRTPLGQVSAFAELLEGEQPPLADRARRYLTNIRTAADRLHVLVDRSLELMSLQSEDVELEAEPIDLKRLVAEALEARAGRMSVTSTGVPFDVQVVGDARCLRRALDILLDTAAGASRPDSPVRVEVHASPTPRITVTNLGTDLPEDVRSYVFGEHADPMLTPQQDTRPLSLLIARRIAELHGGTLQYEARDGETAFTISLPAARPGERPPARLSRRWLVAERETILRQIQEGIIVADAEGRIVFVNDAARAIHGVAGLNVPIEEYSDRYHLFTIDGRPYPPHELPLARAVSKGETVLDEELRIRRPDGAEIIAEASAKPVIAPDGARLGAVLTLRDVTSARRAEAERAELIAREHAARVEAAAASRFRSLTQSAHDAIITANSSDVIVMWNRGAELTFGYTEKEAVGRPVKMLIPHRFWRTYRAYSRRYRRTGANPRRARRVEMAGIRKDGREFPVELSFAVWHDDEQSYFTTIVRDITERREAERLKDKFVSTISDELRTPLTAMQGSLGLVAAGVLGPLPEEARDMIEMALTDTQRLARLVDGILDIQRIESGAAHLVIQPWSAADLVDDAIKATLLFAEERGVILRGVCDDISLHADRERVVQVLVNLLRNAIEVSDEGAHVEVSARQEGSELLVQVRDEGSGIPAGERERIFERFHRVHGEENRPRNGAGLGLTLARGIVRAHRGRMWVESEVGKGSAFFFTIPLDQERTSR